MRLAEAVKHGGRSRQQVAKGIDPSGAQGLDRPQQSFAAVVEEWLQRDQSGNKSIAAMRRIVATSGFQHGATDQLRTSVRRDILALIDSIVDRGSVVMARRVQARLHRLFRWCVGRGIIAVNPVADLPKPGSETKRDRVLSDDELVQVWNGAAALAYPFGPAFQLLILTGARREEIGRAHMVRDPRRHHHPRKAIAPRTVSRIESHCQHQPAALLDSAPRIAVAILFSALMAASTSRHGQQRRKTLDAIVKIDPWRIHDFRRIVASGCQRLGIGLQVVEAILGHTSRIAGWHRRHLSKTRLRRREAQRIGGVGRSRHGPGRRESSRKSAANAASLLTLLDEAPELRMSSN